MRQVLREESNISKVGATKKKGLISSVLSNIPFVGNLMKEPEHLQALDLEKKQVQKAAETAEREAEESKTESNKYKEEIAESIKSGINDMTQPTKKKSFGSMVGDRFSKMVKRRVSNTVDTMVGQPKKIAKTAEDIKRLATQRQCDAQFITGLDKLLNTCSKEEMIKVYNEIVTKMINKKHFFTPRLENEIEKLPVLEYNIKKENTKDINVKNLDITQQDRNTISKLQNNIDRTLGVKKKLKKIKGKTKKKSKIISTQIPNESVA